MCSVTYCGLILHFRVAYDVEYFSCAYKSFLYPLDEVFKCFCQFGGGIIFTLLNCECSLYIINKSPFLDICITNAFSPFVTCIYICLTISFNIIRLPFNEELFFYDSWLFASYLWNLSTSRWQRFSSLFHNFVFIFRSIFYSLH